MKTSCPVQLNVDTGNLRDVCKLGQGMYGSVWLVVDKQNPSVVYAVKRMHLTNDRDLKSHFRKEALIQRMVSNHFNVVKYLGMRATSDSTSGQRLFELFLEYADGGDLFTQVVPDTGMSPVRASYYFKQLMRGLEHIHIKGIAHRDIKLDNLLLTKCGLLKICDFGLATVYRHDGKERSLSAVCGTIPYTAPEVYSGEYKGPPVDIWSAGVVLVSLLTGQFPWEGSEVFTVLPYEKCDLYENWVRVRDLSRRPWSDMGAQELGMSWLDGEHCFSRSEGSASVSSGSTHRSPRERECFQLQEDACSLRSTETRRKSNETEDSGITEGNEEPSTQTLQQESDDAPVVRQLPPQMMPSDFGSPRKVWSALCQKDDRYRRTPNVLEKHQQLTTLHRVRVLDWIMQVCHEKRIRRETFHLCMDILDRFLARSSSPVDKDRIQLVGSAALVIACKMEEVYAPRIEEIADLTDGLYTTEQICDMELIILEDLDWRCKPVTAIQWLTLYLLMMNSDDGYKEAVASVLCREGGAYTEKQVVLPWSMRNEFVVLAKILDLCLLSIESLFFSYSELAAAVVLYCYKPQNFVCEITGYPPNQLASALKFVTPFAKVFERLEPCGAYIQHFDEVPAADQHQIQLYLRNIEGILNTVEEARLREE